MMVGFKVGQAVQLKDALYGPLSLPAGTVGTVVEVFPNQVRVRFGGTLVVVEDSAIEAVPSG